MIALLNLIQRKIRPELNSRTTRMRYLLMSDVVGALYGFPLVLLGLVWLVILTDWAQFLKDGIFLGVILILILIFSRLRFFMVQALRSGQLLGAEGDFVAMILWASLLIFGPEVIWLFFIWVLIDFTLAYQRAINHDMRWDSIRSALLNGASLLIPALLALNTYQHLGGQIPIDGLSFESLAPAMAAILVYALTYFLIWLPFILYIVWIQVSKFESENPGSMFWFTMATMELPFISLPFGVLASGLLVEHGLFVLGIYLAGLLSIALLANQLSRSAARSHRQAVHLRGLEKLGRDILAAPADARNLPSLLRAHIPEMFPCRKADVWLSPETYLLKYPDGKDPYTPDIWDWIMKQDSPQGFLENADLPWENAPERHFALITTPILDPVSGDPIGGLFIELLSMPQLWDLKAIHEHFPALQNLAAQIASALNQAKTYQETLKHQRVTQELKLAGAIQSSFLPDKVPELPGWDIAAALQPARQTSGDFYDFFLLGEDRLGILVADVADKGLGAALYMALGRTLLLTYADEYPENPAAVLQATNCRMLSDARASMFITAFYGVIEPRIGRLIYCNAGHHPPILIRNSSPRVLQKLNPNGMALGIDPNAAWVAVSQRIDVDDTLLLYTDGVVEAHNQQGEFYGIDKLSETAQKIANRPSQWIIRAIQEEVLAFQEGVSQADDITLVCIRRRE